MPPSKGVQVSGRVTGVRAVLLVEGQSDRAAVVALAGRMGRDLDAEGIEVVSMGGAGSIGSFVRNALESHPPRTRIGALSDEAEASHVQRALEQADFGSDLSTQDMEELGFFVCVRDLEDELIRALGTEAIEDLLTQEGDMGSFRTFQNQPHWRARPLDEQFHRFCGTTSGRKVRYGRVLVEALDLSRAPRPLERLLAFTS